MIRRTFLKGAGTALGLFLLGSVLTAPAQAAELTTDADLIRQFVTQFPNYIPGNWIVARTGHNIDRVRGIICVSMINQKTGASRLFKATLRRIPDRRGNFTTYVIPPIVPA